MADSEVVNTAREEEELVRRLKLGHAWAYETLVKRFERKLLAVAYGITLDREESLDIVQDVFISVHKNIERFKGESNLATWLRKITVNRCLNWRRRWKRRFRWHHQPLESGESSYVSEAETSKVTPETLVAGHEMQAHLMGRIQALPEKIRTVFVLRTLDELSYEEIASTLGIKIGTVSSRMYHARRLLLEAMNRHEKNNQETSYRSPS